MEFDSQEGIEDIDIDDNNEEEDIPEESNSES